MTKEDQPLENEDSESEDTSSEFDDMFSDTEDNESNEDSPVTREEFNNLIKGVKKLATDKGREDKKVEPQEDEPAEETKEEVPATVDSNEDINELFYAQTPIAEGVQDDLKTIAEAKYDGSILKAWRGEKWLQEKATAENDVKVQEEKNKAKIDKPAIGYNSSGKVDLTKVKEEDFSKLTAQQKLDWVDIQAKKEQESDIE